VLGSATIDEFPVPDGSTANLFALQARGFDPRVADVSTPISPARVAVPRTRMDAWPEVTNALQPSVSRISSANSFVPDLPAPRRATA
jgi:hypothetical protein